MRRELGEVASPARRSVVWPYVELYDDDPPELRLVSAGISGTDLAVRMIWHEELSQVFIYARRFNPGLSAQELNFAESFVGSVLVGLIDDGQASLSVFGHIEPTMPLRAKVDLALTLAESWLWDYAEHRDQID